MKFTDFKISVEKSWKFTPQVLILISLGIVATLGISILIWQLSKFPQSPPPIVQPTKVAKGQINIQVPQGPIEGIWVRVSKISIETVNRDTIGEYKLGFVEAKMPNFGTTYKLTVNDRLNPIKKIKVIKGDIQENVAGIEDIKIGSLLYVYSLNPNPKAGVDLFKKTTLTPEDKFGINIYYEL